VSQLPHRTFAEDRYVLHEVLGEGGTAVVHRAYDRALERWVAVKVLAPAMARHKQAQVRFEREAKLMLRVDHPNVLKVFELGQGDPPYIVMELVDGGSLLEWISRHGPMPARSASQVGIQICAGIAAAHAVGVIHRDVKPQNILVTPAGVCKVADFGIARLAEAFGSMTRTGVRMGSNGFMAPEQELDAKTVGSPADVFSIGATLFSLVSAVVPQEFRPAFEARAHTLPEPLAHVIMRATLQDPGQRYGSVEALSRALVRIEDLLPPVPDATPALHTVRKSGAGLPSNHTLVRPRGPAADEER
jgi:eukaryotic-like serine/threonine-protein kinase